MNMNDSKNAAAWLQFSKHRVYGPNERYSSGEGLSFMTHDRAHAESAFARANDFANGAVYAVEVREMATDRVLMHSGPSMEFAERSMWAAVRRSTEEQSA